MTAWNPLTAVGTKARQWAVQVLRYHKVTNMSAQLLHRAGVLLADDE
jgi:hypothetical protein